MITSDKDKAEALNSYFSQCFNLAFPPLSLSDNITGCTEQCPPELLCEKDEVLELLLSIDVSKSSGPDGISGRMLKATAHSIVLSVTTLFNKSIASGTVPSGWKTSAVVPIPKGSDNTNVSNYRPISLLSILSKLLELHMHGLIYKHLLLYHPIAIQQWGFQPYKSTVSALVDVTHQWSRHLDNGAEVCVVFFDLKKAFDSVPHRTLINKLSDIGLPQHLIHGLRTILLTDPST